MLTAPASTVHSLAVQMNVKNCTEKVTVQLVAHCTQFDRWKSDSDLYNTYSIYEGCFIVNF